MGSDAVVRRTSRLRESRYNVVVRRDDRVWVYNGLSGHIISLSPDEWAATQAFLAGSERFPAVELLRDLTLGRMIITHDIDELETLERRYRAGTADRTSFGLTIVTSLGCNFDCPYCFQVKPRAILDDETVGLLAANRCSGPNGCTSCPTSSSAAATAPGSPTRRASSPTVTYSPPTWLGVSVTSASAGRRSRSTARPRRTT
jgi:hypothetical protein